MLEKISSELSYYQKNKNVFKNIDNYFDRLYCNLYNKYTNDLKGFYTMIKEHSNSNNQIVNIINHSINHFSEKERFEDCQNLLEIRKNITNNMDKIFE